jgi:hypothetical protein
VKNTTYLKSYITEKRINGLNFVTIILKLIIMPILTILLVLVVVGVILWLVNAYIPMDSKIKSILNVVVVILVIIWLLQAFGLFSSVKNIHV